MNIVILGGGTAGWLTALLVKQFYPTDNITVVESKDIGVLGAGEGTVPHFIQVLDFLGIPVSDLVKQTKATLKLGIEFRNWHGDGTSYHHMFQASPDLNWHACDTTFKGFMMDAVSVCKDVEVSDAYLHTKLTKESKVPFAYANNLFAQDQDPITRLNNYGSFGLHFDARLLADYLCSYATRNGIRHVIGNVQEVKGDDKEVTGLVLEERTIPCDFIFDCSGFARLVVGKHFKSEWISYTEQMPLDTAMPFFIPHDDKNIKPQTTAIAMKYGWVWQIPVQGRYGCGYVFDSSYITEEEALLEVKEIFGEVESPRTFKFKAGMYKDTYVGNSLAVGLAQGFIEPLEATSIWTSCVNLIQFLRNDGINSKAQAFRDAYNEQCYDRNHEVVEFLHLHYLTKRNDSDFWKNFKNKTVTPERLQKKLALWKDMPITEFDRFGELFLTSSWIQVANGTRVVSAEESKRHANMLYIPHRLKQRYALVEQNQADVIKGCLTHEELISFLKG